MKIGFYLPQSAPRAGNAVSRLARMLPLIVIAFGITTTPLHAAEPDAADRIENTRSALEQWVETRRLISQEKRDLALSKEMLNGRIELVENEITALREKIGETGKSIDEADRKRADFVADNEKLKDAASSLGGTLETLETRTLALLPRLPDSLRERVKPLSQRIPAGASASTSTLSLSERFQNVVGVLNEVNRFNREITVASEVRTLPDGSSAEVTAIYLGLGQAFYTGSGGAIAGVGIPSDEGWIWKPANEAAPRIASIVAILKNEQVASFVQLPIEIQQSARPTP